MSSEVAAHSHPEKPKHKPKDKNRTNQKNPAQPTPTSVSQSALSKVLQDDLSSAEEVEGESGPGNVNVSLVPTGSILLHEVVEGHDFDYDKVKDDEDLEIWVIRVPDGVKSKHLNRLSLSLPPPLATTSQKVGSLARKNDCYDVWSIYPPAGDSSNPDQLESYYANDDEGEVLSGNTVGGEELFNMNVLLPRKKKGGKLFVAPKPISQHLILTAQSAQPSLPTPPLTPDASSFDALPNSHMYKSPARYQHPKHLLKHRFVPTGAGLRVSPVSSRPPSGYPAGSTESAAAQAGTTKEKPGDPDEAPETEETKDGKEKKEKKKKDRRAQGEEEKVGEAPQTSQASPKKKRKAEEEGKKRAKKTKTDS